MYIVILAKNKIKTTNLVTSDYTDNFWVFTYFSAIISFFEILCNVILIGAQLHIHISFY